jgi:chromosome partitioning protein
LADTVLIPFWNDQDSYDGVRKTAGLARRLGKPAFGILNFATPNSRIHEQEALAVLTEIRLPMASIVLHRYEVHRDAKIVGLTAQEMEPGSVAAREIEMLWNWLRAMLQLGTGAEVHNSTGNAA